MSKAILAAFLIVSAIGSVWLAVDEYNAAMAGVTWWWIPVPDVLVEWV